MRPLNILTTAILATVLAACSSDSDNPSTIVDDNPIEIAPEVAPDATADTTPVITSDSPPDNGSDALSVANAEEILNNVVSVINEEAIEAFYQTAIDDNLFQGKAFFISNTSADIQIVGENTLETPYPLEVTYDQGDIVDANNSSEYTCAGGGTLVGYFAGSDQATDWVFDNCVIGSNTYSGTAGSRLITRGAINPSPVFDLTIEDSNGQTRSLSGGYSFGNQSFAAINSQSNWDSAEYRGPVDNGELTIEGYTVSRMRQDDNVDRFDGSETLSDGTVVQINEYSVTNAVNGNFTVTAPWTDNESLAVTVDLSFNDNVRIARDAESGDEVEYSGTDPEDASYWQSGSITIEAVDGSQLLVTPAEGQSGDFIITTDSGETVGPLTVDLKP